MEKKHRFKNAIIIVITIILLDFSKSNRYLLTAKETHTGTYNNINILAQRSECIFNSKVFGAKTDGETSLHPSAAPWMTLLCPRHLTCCCSDGCLPSGRRVPALSSGPQRAERLGEGAGRPPRTFRAGDKTTVPCHHSGDKTGLLFTDRTSTLYHLTP